MNRILRRDTPKSQSAEAQEGKYGARGDMETVTETNDALCDLGRVAEVYRYLEDIVEGVVALGALERRCRVLLVSAKRMHHNAGTVSDVESDVCLVSWRGSSANEVSVQSGNGQTVGRSR